MTDISFTLSNVSDVAVANINADATLSAGGSGNRLFWAGIGIATKGQPFECLSINRNNVKSVLGKPLHPSVGIASESLRHVNDALKGGAGTFVRVVPDDAQFPVLKFTETAKSAKKDADQEKTKVATRTMPTELTPSSLPFGTDVTLEAADLLAFYIVDGDASTNRSVEMETANITLYDPGFYKITVYETDSSGLETVLEEHFASLNPEATDDMGMPAYIETVLENNSKMLRALVAPRLAEMPLGAIPKATFVGGTSGDITNISKDMYDKALLALKSTLTQYTHVLGLGIYEPDVIKSLTDIANSRRISAYFDMNPRLSYADAVDQKIDLAMGDERASFFHFPFSAMDPTYRCKAVWGISGIAFTAKAIGVAKTSPIGGWHYTFAGEERSLITRTAVTPLPSAGEPDYEEMYRVRINKVDVSTNTGYLFIDDSLTSYPKKNYLRFEQIVSVADAVSRDTVDLARSLKHEPDGVTLDGLTKGLTRLLDGYVTSGALVPPSEPDIYGTDEYRYTIKKTDKDAWEIAIYLSVTGSGRRFMIKPILIP